MTDRTIRQPRFVTFPEADEADRRVAAILICEDADTGKLKAWVKDVPGQPEPDPELVAMLVESLNIRKLI